MKVKSEITDQLLMEIQRLEFHYHCYTEHLKGMVALSELVKFDLTYFQDNEKAINDLLDAKKMIDYISSKIQNEVQRISDILASNEVVLKTPAQVAPLIRTELFCFPDKQEKGKKLSQWIKKIFWR